MRIKERQLCGVSRTDVQEAKGLQSGSCQCPVWLQLTQRGQQHMRKLRERARVGAIRVAMRVEEGENRENRENGENRDAAIKQLYHLVNSLHPLLFPVLSPPGRLF